jgi:hypothetical protein
VNVVRVVLHTEEDIETPLVLLLPRRSQKEAVSVVVAVSQAGKQALLAKRTEAIARLLDEGIAVCLPDVRGTGETRSGDDRGRASTATSVSATALMLGRPLLGGRLRDLRSVLAYLRQRGDINAKRIALWGDSFAPVNPTERDLCVPLDAAALPNQAEPLGGLLALFGALFEEDVRAVFARGSLISFHSILDSPFLYVPHDVVVPGALAVSDLADVAVALAPRPLWLEGLVDGRNVRVPQVGLNQAYDRVRQGYGQGNNRRGFNINPILSSDADTAAWLAARLKDCTF